MTAITDPVIIRTSNPFEAARLQLVKRLLALRAPAALGVNPHPVDVEAVAQHVRDVTNILDDWLSDTGAEVKLVAPDLDMRDFTDAFSATIDGNATFLIEEVANEMRDARRVA